MSETGSPPGDTDHISSRATIDPFEIWVRASWNSPSFMPRAPASSSSVGARCRRLSSSADFFSIARARARTDRGTQSSARSSSMMAPLMRVTA